MDKAAATSPKRAKLSERGADLYETPREATEALLKCEMLPKKIWEPAAGHGAIAKVLRAHGHEVVATDLIDYGEPDLFSRWDFLMEYKAPDGCDCIVTNPPYSLADEFVRHALKLCPNVVMLLRLLFLEGTSRSDIVDEHLKRVHIFRNRLPRMHRHGWTGKKASSTVAFAWFVFQRGYTGPIEVERVTWGPV